MKKRGAGEGRGGRGGEGSRQQPQAGPRRGKQDSDGESPAPRPRAPRTLPMLDVVFEHLALIRTWQVVYFFITTIVFLASPHPPQKNVSSMRSYALVNPEIL